MSQQEQGLEALYGRHPQREETILDRVRQTDPHLAHVTELDLAFDPRTEITDQNHVGGLPFLVDLAAAAEVTRDKRVLNLGAGLGGPCRALSYLYGCRTHGVEITRVRYESSLRLTGLTNLGARVDFTHGDALDDGLDIPGGPFDVLVGQSSFMQIGDAPRLLGRCAAFLRPRGVLAFEDTVLRGAREDPRVGELEQLWAGDLLPLPTWRRHLEDAGFRVDSVGKLGAAAARYFERWLELGAARRDRPFAPVEVRAWQLATELLRERAIDYVRVVATRTTGDD